jgi:hypothetical protein
MNPIIDELLLLPPNGPRSTVGQDTLIQKQCIDFGSTRRRRRKRKRQRSRRGLAVAAVAVVLGVATATTATTNNSSHQTKKTTEKPSYQYFHKEFHSTAQHSTTQHSQHGSDGDGLPTAIRWGLLFTQLRRYDDPAQHPHGQVKRRPIYVYLHGSGSCAGRCDDKADVLSPLFDAPRCLVLVAGWCCRSTFR